MNSLMLTLWCYLIYSCDTTPFFRRPRYLTNVDLSIVRLSGAGNVSTYITIYRRVPHDCCTVKYGIKRRFATPGIFFITFSIFSRSIDTRRTRARQTNLTPLVSWHMVTMTYYTGYMYIVTNVEAESVV